jgi:hypothetical protein
LSCSLKAYKTEAIAGKVASCSKKGVAVWQNRREAGMKEEIEAGRLRTGEAGRNRSREA